MKIGLLERIILIQIFTLPISTNFFNFLQIAFKAKLTRIN